MERVRAAHPSLRSGVMALISCVGRQGPAAGPQRLHAPFEGDQGTAALALCGARSVVLLACFPIS